METSSTVNSGLMTGFKNSLSDIRFDNRSMEPLVKSMRSGLIELLPIEDRPAYYMLWISAQLRDFFRNDEVIVPQTVYQLTSNFHRSASFFSETLVIHKKRPSQKVAVFSIIPGDYGTAERAILQQVASLREDLTPDYANVLLAVFRQSVTEDQYPETAKILGSRLYQVGEYTVGDSASGKHRLYIAGFGISLSTPDLTLFT